MPRTQPGVVVGTWAHLSPEQALGQPIGDRSDIFSFGTMLYEMLAGRRPFGEGTLAGLLSGPPPPPGSLRKDAPPALDALVAECPDKTSARRPGARNLADRLGLLRGRAPTSASARARRAGRR